MAAVFVAVAALCGPPALAEPAPVAAPAPTTGTGGSSGTVAESRERQAAFPPSFRSAGEPARVAAEPPRSGWDTLTSSALPLGVVLVVIVGAACLFRKAVRSGGSLAASLGAAGRAPAGLLEVLGRYPVSRGQTLVLLRVDQRVLLLSQCQPVRGDAGRFSTLCEMSDPADVASILTKVSETEGTGPASRFNQLLAEADGEHRGGTIGGLVDRLRRAVGHRSSQPVSWVEPTVDRAPTPEEVAPPTMRLTGVDSLRSRLAAVRAAGRATGGAE